METIKVSSANQENGGPISTICPHCGGKGTFAIVGPYDLLINNAYYCGQRVCPDPKCRGHLFIILDQKRDLIFQYPPVRTAFSTQNIPEAILKTFNEAVTSHAQTCFVASAIMIRRTLEEICDERGANGKDLKERINDLKAKVVLPPELFDAMDELRVLGNDAAHIEAKTYDQISKPELDVAIEFTIELLKALYQYSGLLTKMRGLKKSSP